MPEINILPKEVYQLIAAGEVVERPASIVKEMIENSIDAGAADITVEIKNGGISYIRITDNGCGIEKSQVKKVFIPHATSKIRFQNDLDSIATLGFRGEAMASVAAVAKVELLTRTKNSPEGTRYEIHGGEEKDFSPVGCPEGTTFVVRDIFYNTPARMKFLKKDVTEGNAVSAVVDSMAVSHPEISFRFIRDGKQTLITSGNNDLKSVAYSVFGKDFSSSLIEVDYSINNMRLSGLVTKPYASRKSRAMQYFFINSRFVKSKTAVAALEQAYKNSVMVGRFPGCILNIECDSSLVDVNVHPAKIEVRFSDERKVFELVYYGVKNAVEANDTPKSAQFTPQKNVQTTASGKLDLFIRDEDKPRQMEFRQKTNPDMFWNIAASSPKYNEKLDITVDDDEVGFSNSKNNCVQDEHISVFDEKLNNDLSDKSDEQNTGKAARESEKREIVLPDFRVIGEAFKTYIIVEIKNDIYFIDKHAAHERINYEQLVKSSQINSQMLISPVTVRLSKEEYDAVCNNIDLYSKCGFDIENFGESTVIVRSCPSILNGEDIEDLICETAAKLLDGKTDITPERMDWIFHSASCRAAVKAGDCTSPYEMELFVKKLLSMPEIRYCPHGRPIMIKMSKYDIEKQFGRA